MLVALGRKIFSRSESMFIPFCKLNVVFRSTCKLTNLSRFKDYSNVTYYGKTLHHFFTKASKHMGPLNLIGKFESDRKSY